METKEVIMEKEKETKNKIRFSEVITEDQLPILGTLYIPKYIAKKTEKIKVIIEEA